MKSADERLDELRRRKAQSEAGGGSQRIDAQHNRGKMTARERLEMLLDDGSFQEVDALVEHRCTDFGMEGNIIPGDGVVCAMGPSMEKPYTVLHRISQSMVEVSAKCTD